MKEVVARTRIQAAVALKIAGSSYSEIADALGFADAGTAQRAIEQSLAAAAGPESVLQLRELTRRRLEKLLRSVMAPAIDVRNPQHLAYNARALAIVDRLARLDGVDAPVQAIIHTPDAKRVEEYVASVLALARATAEPDILEMEIIEELPPAQASDE